MSGDQSRLQMVTQIATLVLVLILIALSLGLHDRRDADGRNIDYLVVEKQKGSPMTTPWVSGGVTKSLTTPRRGDEDYDDWFDRHDAELAAAKIRYPPD